MAVFDADYFCEIMLWDRAVSLAIASSVPAEGLEEGIPSLIPHSTTEDRTLIKHRNKVCISEWLQLILEKVATLGALNKPEHWFLP